ncbi:sialate O-acetylesterase [Nibricoccus aquaticus]|uniref:Sialate O-acetylesterase n=1 Tax=Nibricoccus aquaticus TaxID=2576891 RepID=A0A290QA71_9BACT|nr:sialate O-acetylesterase [Nibricoccus aquaticus]ATC65414.1 sialate O-acetylesterase [Nibricoccus aquaticus]
MRPFLYFAAMILAANVSAEVRLAALFTDHTVLQRRVEIPVWGWASPGENVSVEFRAHTARAVADANGRWQVKLPAMEAGAPAEMIVRGTNEVRLRDVVLGEVWLCSGQSNMAFRVEELDEPEEEAAAEYPDIRHFAVGIAVAMEPAESVEGRWMVCSPATVGRFTATGYYFARELQRKLGVPVGLINASVGGTQIESWMSAEALASDPAFAVVAQRWAEALANYPVLAQAVTEARTRWNAVTVAERFELARAGLRPGPMPPGPGNRDTPSSLFNAMIHPLMPYAIRGTLWDQGGANASRYSEYGRLFCAMIEDWRTKWNGGQLPFLFVQAPNFLDPKSSGYDRAGLRLAQAEALKLPATEMAVTVDIGETNNVHPLNKRQVGARLAAIARAKVYGENLIFSGPRFRSAERIDDKAVRVNFETWGEALVSASERFGGFELATAEGNYVAVSARIEGTGVVLTVPEGVQPLRVVYAWGDDPACDLRSASGLPAAPFIAELR